MTLDEIVASFAEERGVSPRSARRTISLVLRMLLGGLARDGVVDLGDSGQLRWLAEQSHEAEVDRLAYAVLETATHAPKLETLIDGVVFIFDVTEDEPGTIDL